MTSTTTDVLIVGAGLQGCSAAVHLRRRGYDVRVIERDRVGRHASGVNAGGVRRLGRHFAEVPLSVAANRIWHDMQDLVGDDCGFVPSGQIQVAETEQALAQQRDRVRALTELGFTHEHLIDDADLRARLPAAAPHCVGGIAVDGDGFADPFRTVTAFARRARDLGARIDEGTALVGLEMRGTSWRATTSRGPVEAAYVLNCAGAWGHRMAAMLGDHVPLRAEAPMLMITSRLPVQVRPVVGAVGRPLSFKQYADGRVLIGGGFRGSVDGTANRAVVDTAELVGSARTAAAIFPMVRKAQVVRAWAGIEGMLPDGIPVIGPSAAENAVHAFGFCGHGFQLGPVVGEILADIVDRGRSRLPLDAFRVDRFND